MENTKCRSRPWGTWAFAARWVAVLGYAGLLFYLSSFHHPSVPSFFLSDKILHLSFYAGFGLTFIWACHPGVRDWATRKVVALAGLGAFVYGMTDEFHQRFVSGRTPDVVDLIFDALGGMVGGGLYLALVYTWRSRRKGKVQAGSPSSASF